MCSDSEYIYTYTPAVEKPIRYVIRQAASRVSKISCSERRKKSDIDPHTNTLTRESQTGGTSRLDSPRALAARSLASTAGSCIRERERRHPITSHETVVVVMPGLHRRCRAHTNSGDSLLAPIGLLSKYSLAASGSSFSADVAMRSFYRLLENFPCRRRGISVGVTYIRAVFARN